MDLVNQFIENYKRRFQFYETAGRLAAKQLEDALQSAGIRAIVTSRAKNPGRLKSKVLRRNSRREVPYKNMREIYEDIADLSGVRVSLYFPGDREKANALIADLFAVLETKQFPEQSKPPSYNKRFSGYWANHYRAHMREEHLDPSQQKYAAARIEIQVASVLMHAWSEVEHDLIYKPLQGTLSEEELAIIDELNGLVLTGEIALERLQNAGNERIRNKSTSFVSQYDLASYLYNYLSNNFRPEDIELRMGNVELLFKLLNHLKITTVKEIEPILKSVKFEKDRRNISQQIIDQIITGSEKRYQSYRELRSDESRADEKTRHAVDEFFTHWVRLENTLNRMTYKNAPRSRGAFNINSLKRLNILSQDALGKIASLRKLRNVLIHDIEIPDVEMIQKQAREAQELLGKINEI
ncbi:RelA/SpoT protein [Clostridium sp. MCC353]|uniref:RelA/SpoT domain-containing protein n=1 Tax=Clostridium sp. MCC353 TaxID=2592646 RepID=UPI001C0207EC|nr:RelA/SpoT domain-containing protein [Clostridium sp. MCC353]MBT9776120.1 RelA/SpoT protein [Clostridium sp. MCC353]